MASASSKRVTHVPIQVGRFHLGRALEAYGSAQLFEAEERFIGGVVRRCLALAVGRDAREDRRSVQLHGEILRRLDHPHLTRLVAIGQANDVDYLFVDRPSGRTLHEISATGRRISAWCAIRIGADLASALAHAHTLYTNDHSRLAHLRLGPDAVYIDGGGRAVLSSVGFGPYKPAMWRPLGAEPEGNLRFVAPEQLANRGGTARSDLFTLGIMILELLGDPLESASVHQPRCLEAEIDLRSTRLPRSIRTDLRSVLAGVLQRDPALRVADAAEVAVALSAMVDRPEKHLGAARPTFSDEAITSITAGMQFPDEPTIEVRPS
jgi:serine/threonine-protein kinase